MRILFVGCVFILLYACNSSNKTDTIVKEKPNYLQDVAALTSDSMVNVVIEIPAGTNQKYELNKKTGQIEWEQVTPDSLRVINYLPYPANYGFVPQTLVSEATGGDGDPVDVFVLGEQLERGKIVPCKIIGFIEMTDNGEIDNKLIALPVHAHWREINSLQELNQYYPGVIDILEIWLSNYKGADHVKILSLNDEKAAIQQLKTAHTEFLKQKNNK